MLNKKYALNSECVLNRKGLAIESGAIYRVPYPLLEVPISLRSRWKSILSRVSFEDIIKSFWHPILGEQLTLEREDGNNHDRHQTS